MTVLSPLCAALAFLIFSASVFAEARLQVRVQPANAALKENVEGYIGSLENKDIDDLQRFRRSAETQATTALQALGYYQPQISSEVTTSPPTLILDIAPGEPVRLREVEVRIEGPAQQLSAFRLPKAARMQPGDALNHGRYEAAKRHIQNQASRYCFFSGHFSQQSLRIDPQGGVADVELVYVSGPRHHMGEVSFSGDTPFEGALLQRMVPFERRIRLRTYRRAASGPAFQRLFRIGTGRCRPRRGAGSADSRQRSIADAQTPQHGLWSGLRHRCRAAQQG